MELVGEKVLLRPLAISDLIYFKKWNQDEELQCFTDSSHGQELELLKKWYQDSLKSRYYKIFTIVTKNDLVIGDLELDHICWNKREAELRIRIGEKNYWNQGLGSEALKIIVKHIMIRERFNRIYLRVYQFNQRAIHCYLKNGFKKVGILQRKKPGWKNIILMELKKADYFTNQKNLVNYFAG